MLSTWGEKTRNAYKGLVLKMEENIHFGPSRGREDNVTIPIGLK
jgi:hypothetical protein